jgi:hypothetical protein
MRIGFSGEDSTHRALLNGLRLRWCPNAEFLEGRFRGTSDLSARREIPNICAELSSKGADLITLLRDSNVENWRDVLRADEARCRDEHKHLAVFGVCKRNPESWICSDAEWIAARMGKNAADFRVDDPKGVFETAMAISRADRKEEEIAALVVEAPLRNWLANPSFDDFYSKLWRKSKELGCSIENLHAG